MQFGLRSLLLLLLALFATSCKQDPIFYKISREVEPREGRIKGVPTKMALFEYESGKWGLYVAGSSLHRYAKNKDGEAVWDDGIISLPEGKVFDLAATKNYLYVLIDPDDPKLYRLGQSPADWERVKFKSGEGGSLQAIYSETNSEGIPVTGYLYAGVGQGSSYAVFYTDENNTDLNLTRLKEGTSLLSGAAFDGTKHYFSTNGDGIYLHNSDNTVTKISAGTETVTGMIQIGNTDVYIVALCYDGDIYKVGSSTTKLNSEAIGYHFRGPATVWTETDGSRLLLAAVSSTPTHGYREILLDSGPLATGAAGEILLRHPGDANPTTVDDDDLYDDTIGIKPINSILMVPSSINSGPNPLLFASIQGTGTSEKETDGGLWSYRIRDSKWQWNAEE
jgi:hypothetical protein